MKTLKIILFATSLLFQFTYSQETTNDCGLWDAVIVSIERDNDSFIVTGKNYMPDCTTPSGIYFEWLASKDCIRELATGMRIDFDKFKPVKGFWKYKRILAANELEKLKNKKK